MSGRRLLWLLLLGLGLALLVLIIRHDDGTIAGLQTHDFASLAIKVALIVFFGGFVLALFRHRFRQALEAAVFWMVIALFLAAGYSYRVELREIGDRILSELVPGRAAQRGTNVEITRARSGDFQVAIVVNGAHVPMVLDTGASAVVLTQEAAKAAGLPLEFLTYNVNIETANGRTRAASVTLDRVAVGSILERKVPALIAQPGQLRTSLLGMSFLNRLQSWEVRGDRLMMRGQ
ncbi:MAG: TIGR02281 family clan AA aspartic protease [Xanthobacteraceae bacterium]